MNLTLAEMTRDQVQEIAPRAVAVLPTASTEQHGPHLPICTDSLLCETVATRAASIAAPGSSSRRELVLAPTLCYGDSDHHNPFPGVLSLQTSTYIEVVTQLCRSLARSGFQRIAVINGHGGNDAGNDLAVRQLLHRDGLDISFAAVAYWDIARAALVAETALSNGLVPGHAGQFETALVMAIRPELVEEGARKKLKKGTSFAGAKLEKLKGARQGGAWEAGGGYTDSPANATAEDGQRYLEIITREVGDFLADLAGA